MRKDILLAFLLTLCFGGIVFAGDANPNEISKYIALYDKRDFETIINDFIPSIEDYESGKESFLDEQSITQARNLVADSYRMIGKYSKASIWYALTSDGYSDSYANYCFEIIKQSATFPKDQAVKDTVEKVNYYSILAIDGPSDQEALFYILKQLEDKTTVKEKRQFFRELSPHLKNNWIKTLTRYYSGNISLDELLTSVPKEDSILANIYAGLFNEIGGNISRARQLYQSAIEQHNFQPIETLLALNSMGLYTFKIVYSVKNETDLGATLQFVNLVRASSAKLESSWLYGVRNLLDGDPTTTWVPSSKKSGIGEWVEISFDDPMPVNSIIITNGYTKSNTAFKNNNRVKTATLEFSDGSKQKVSLQDSMKPQEIKIGKSTQKIRLYIDEVYKGEKYDDTCLSEVDLKFDTPKE